MIRAVVAVVVAALVVIAVAAATPAPVEPDFGEVVVPEPAGGAGTQSSVWYCAWVDSGAIRDSTYDLASAVDVDGAITLPSPIPNEEPDRLQFSLIGPGARSVDVATIVRRGEAPGFVEFDDGPASAGALVFADSILTGDRCVVSTPKLWHLPGGTTREGYFTSLRLFNPFPDDAKVTISGASEFGSVALPEFEGLDVPGRSWVTIELNRIVPFLDELALAVRTDEGIVVPTLVLADENDEASWPGTGLSTLWEFPVTSVEGLQGALALHNPGPAAAVVTIDTYTEEGAIGEPLVVDLPSVNPIRIALGELAPGPVAVRVRADSPIAVVAEAAKAAVDEEDIAPPDEAPPADDTGETTTTTEPLPGEDVRGLAATVGAPVQATRWLLPGAGFLTEASATLWVLNTGDAPATVSLTPLGADPFPSSKFIIAAGTAGSLPLPSSAATGATGYMVDSTVPVSAAWSVVADRGAAFIAGVPVG